MNIISLLGIKQRSAVRGKERKRNKKERERRKKIREREGEGESENIKTEFKSLARREGERER